MKIFLGSSTESARTMNEVAGWLEKEGRHSVYRWKAPGVIHQGHAYFDEHLRIITEMDGALFIFAEDDKVQKRDRATAATRDNVIFEYGMFVGFLGRESVLRLVVGEPDTPTDLHGLHVLRLPPKARTVADRRTKKETLGEVLAWAKRLSPVYLKRLGVDLAKHLARKQQTPVEDILVSKARRFVSRNKSSEIRALCSDKGGCGGRYYGYQFNWLANRRGKRRRLRRIFVRGSEREGGYCRGFSKGEVEGILLHLDERERTKTIGIRWIDESDVHLGGTYSSDLGFAIFGKSWLVHWGLEAGTFHDEEIGRSDDGVGDLLKRRWDALWRHAFDFDRQLIEDLRASVASGRGEGREG